MFLQGDSSPGGMLGESKKANPSFESLLTGDSGVPHTSFYNPQASAQDLPRESIEVRAFAYFTDE